MAAVMLEHALAPQPLRVTAAGRRSLRAWNSQPCSPFPPFPIAPALRQDLGCSRIVHRAGQTVMACCDRCGHPH